MMAFDPGKETGWARLTDSGQVIEAGSIKADTRRELWDALRSLEADTDTAVCEELIAYGTNTDSERFKVEGIIELWCEMALIKRISMHPGTVKKLITGRGNCKKSDLRRALKERVEIPGKSNVHVVDAVAVGLAYLIQHKGLLL